MQELAYKLLRRLEKAWKEQNLTVKDGLGILSGVNTIEVRVKERPLYQMIPQPNEQVRQLLDAVGAKLPQTIKLKGVRISARKKLPLRRKAHAKP